jgi:heat shock protein HslJ
MRTRLAAIVMATLLLAGCASTPGTPAPDQEDPVTGSIVGEWQLVKGGDSEGALAVRGVGVTLAIHDKKVAGMAPCNSYSGSITVDGTAVTFGPLTATQRGCGGGDPDAIEERYFAALAQVTESSRKGDSLKLTGETATLSFTLLEKKTIKPPPSD